MHPIRSALTLLVALSIASGGSNLAQADGGVTFREVARGGSSGINFFRVPTPDRKAEMVERRSRLVSRSEQTEFAAFPDGTPGILIFDYDNDGDEDIYVTQGPGADNSLFQNQLAQTGQLTFIDVGASAGVGARDMDSVGACSADVDNDGDMDLLVVGIAASPRFFINQGDGTFVDKSVESGFAGAPKHSITCSFGDFDNDGLVDVVIANTWNDWSNVRQAVDQFAYNEHNQTFHNIDGLHFVDTSATSGIRNLGGLPPNRQGAATVTWSVAAIDYDQDGNIDIIEADDQNVPAPFAFAGGYDIGIVRAWHNDGTGHFTDTSDIGHSNGLKGIGAFMGLSFGDFNCDGNIDIFGTNGGDYFATLFGLPAGTVPSEWFLGLGNGKFLTPGLGSLIADPFGWGVSTFDYDNDGDQDIIFHGGQDTGNVITADNPGSLLQNHGCSAQFSRDAAAVRSSGTDHTRRIAYGVAVGDLDNNGFPDMLSAASCRVPPDANRIQYPPFGSAFDDDAARTRVFPVIPGTDFLAWNGVATLPGDLSVEINNGENGNHWASLQLEGSIGLVNNQTSRGTVNRSAVGAVVKFTPDGGKPILHPVVAGESYGSQNSLRFTVGMGTVTKGTVEILWPGGVRNKLYDVQAGERLLIPEIPCSFTTSQNSNDYRKCVRESLKDLRHPRVDLITEQQFKRFEDSALRAYAEAHSRR